MLSICNDFFDNDWMVKANATAPAINVFDLNDNLNGCGAAGGL